MFVNDNEDDDLFLSDIGSLSQIYDKMSVYNKNFVSGNHYKKRSGKNPSTYWDQNKDEEFNDKKFRNLNKNRNFDKFNSHDEDNVKNRHFTEKDERNINSYSRYETNENIFISSEKSPETKLYDDAEIVLPKQYKEIETNESVYYRNEDNKNTQLYDEFELNIKSNASASDSVHNSSKSLSDSLSNMMHSRPEIDVFENLSKSSSTTHSGQKIPILSRNESSSTNASEMNQFSIQQSNTSASHQFHNMSNAGLPPQALSYSDQSYSLNNPPPPGFMNSFHTENSGLFSQYGRPIINNTPEFFSNSSSSSNMPYSNFQNNMSQSHGWIPVMNPPAPNIPPVQCSINEAPVLHEDSQNNIKPNREDAVKEEIRQQNKSLKAQRDQYHQKLNLLGDELNKLKKQKKVLMEGKKSHQAEQFLKENNRLQSEIQNKIKAVGNIIDMLSKIIKDDDGNNKNSIENSKRNSDDRKVNCKDKKLKRKYSSRSRSKSKYRSRSKSKPPAMHSPSRSRSRYRSRSHGRSSSPSPKRHRHRSRSRDRHHHSRRSYEKHSKNYPKRLDRNKITTDDTEYSKNEETVINTYMNPSVESDFEEVQDKKSLSSQAKWEILNEKKEALKPQLDILKYYSEKSKPASLSNTVSEKNVVPISNLIEMIHERQPSKENIRKNETTSGNSCKSERINYVYYDPELHWCDVCNVFPQTAKEYLLHLHDSAHKNELSQRNMIDYPWHKTQALENKKPVYEDAPTERVPIRGLQFFVSATAWYCKLCNEWMGDLHCASAHLKSDIHKEKFWEYFDENPSWEENWLQNRNKAHTLYKHNQEEKVFTCALPPLPSSDSVSSDLNNFKLKASQLVTSSICNTGLDDVNSKLMTNDNQKGNASKKQKTDDKRQTNDKLNDRKSNATKQDEQQHAARSNTVKQDEQQHAARPNAGKQDEQQHAARPNAAKQDEQQHAARPNAVKQDEQQNAARSNATKESKQQHATRSNVTKQDKQQHATRSSNATKQDQLQHAARTFGKKPLKFPFIGKMPSKSLKKNESDSKSKIVFKGLANASNEQTSSKTNDNRLANIMKKQLEEYDKTIIKSAEQDSCNMVVDMDINDDEDEPLSIVIDENISRKNDFDETLKILYPEDQQISMQQIPAQQIPVQQIPVQQIPAPQICASQIGVVSSQIAPHPTLPQNLTQDYLISLIESTLMEKLKLKLPGYENENSFKVGDLANSMQQALLNVDEVNDKATNLNNIVTEVVSDVSVPFEITQNSAFVGEPPPPGELPPSQSQNSSMVSVNESNDDFKIDKNKSSGSETETHKKKKNPISQKKRRHLRKIREKLEEQEKQLQEKIEETKKSLAEVYSPSEVVTPAFPEIEMDSELMLLGIDKSDSAALQF